MKNRHRYPKDWDAIARAVKDAARWHCQQCGKPCRPPGVPLSQTGDWLAANFPQWHDSGDRPHRFTLTVAHLDHDPSNCDRANLRAMCAPCHLRNDAAIHAQRAAATRDRQRGQLNLFHQ